jgi:GT2 family glycosyltransferase
VDAASTDPAARARAQALAVALRPEPAVFLRRTEASLGAARSAGVDRIGTDWVLFLDDDNALADDAVAVFAQAAATGRAAVWTAWAILFEGHGPPAGTPADAADASLYAPLGPVPGLMGRSNCLGDAGLLVARETYQALGGFDPDPHTGAEDWDFLVRAWLAEVPQRVIPRALLWKRLSADSMSATMDRVRAAGRVRARLRAAGLPA